MTNSQMKRGGGGGGDLVFESRHLLGLFLGVVVLCGVFFTLGYVMGRTQYETSVRAATGAKPSLEPSKRAEKTPAPAPSEWEFYRAGERKKPEDRLEPAAPPKETVAVNPTHAAKSPPATSGSAKALAKPPLIPRGAIVLQVAALTNEGDALALAQLLQQKHLPAFVLTPTTDKFYRVQVGPYAEAKSAEAARHSLEREGFKAIAKR